LNHRPYDPIDEPAIRGFTCSTGPWWEAEVENWIRSDAVGWLSAGSARFQRRNLHLAEDDGELVAVFAWRDIVEIDADGIWLDVVAVTASRRHSGVGRQVLALVLAHLVAVERGEDVIAGLVHPNNVGSQAMLVDAGWQPVRDMRGYRLMVGRIGSDDGRRRQILRMPRTKQD
jgi:GNAT superfamily N-acetyltransferase